MEVKLGARGKPKVIWKKQKDMLDKVTKREGHIETESWFKQRNEVNAVKLMKQNEEGKSTENYKESKNSHSEGNRA